MSNDANTITTAERRKAIWALRQSGETLEAIGQKMQISRSRVSQLIATERRHLLEAPPARSRPSHRRYAGRRASDQPACPQYPRLVRL